MAPRTSKARVKVDTVLRLDDSAANGPTAVIYFRVSTGTQAEGNETPRVLLLT